MTTPSTIRRRLKAAAALVLSALVAPTLAACSNTAQAGTDQASDTVNLGVLYPKTGDYAEYGALFEQGIDLAVEKVNATGGVQGKLLGVKYFDTQSDPKQDAAVAPKLVADPSIIAVIGDYSSPASKAASPAFQQAGLVHYGFNNSAPDFVSTGDHVWSPAYGTDNIMPVWAQGVADSGAKKISVVYIENDWGAGAYGYFEAAAKKLGLDIVYQSAYPATDTDDYSPILIKARDAKPDATVQLGYGEGAQIVNTLRDTLGYTGPFFGGQNTPEFLSVSGKNGYGTVTDGIFTADDDKALIQQFVKDFRAKYNTDPGDFNLTAYQAVIDLAYGVNKTSATREGVQQALQTVTDFPSYVGKSDTFQFDQATRRVKDPQPILLVDKDGKFVRLG
ncbi:MAG: ABC transporter substrate-binding protein [Propionibacteriaceae bacterium]|jgi:branched-chain amino acid transport system substrate-binding protein|nr:ABC transporter substrate-binding protein [Propionibacteriaceae bacterium]